MRNVRATRNDFKNYVNISAFDFDNRQVDIVSIPRDDQGVQMVSDFDILK